MQKNVKSHVFGFSKKNEKNVFSNYDSVTHIMPDYYAVVSVIFVASPEHLHSRLKPVAGHISVVSTGVPWNLSVP